MKMFLLFSHKLTSEQIEDSKKNLKVEEFIYLPEELQKIWSNIPAEIENLNDLLKPIKKFLKKNINRGDYILIQGDFGAVYKFVRFAKKNQLKPIYATTKREFTEKEVNGKIIKTSTFSHVRFREY